MWRGRGHARVTARAGVFVVAVLTSGATGGCQLPADAPLDGAPTPAIDAEGPQDSGATTPRPSPDAGAPAPDAVVPLTVGSCGALPAAPPEGLCRATAGMTWCWENPMPMGESINALGGTSAGDVWALTDTMVLHGVDGRWTDTMDGIFLGGAFYTSGPADVWLAAGFRPFASSPASSPAPADALDGYAPPSIWHWDGQAWTVAYSFDFVPEAPLQMTGIWGSSRRDIWATADGTYGGALIHYDGTSWSQVSTGALSGQSFETIWGRGPDDVWTVASSPADLYHFDGKSWIPSSLQPDDAFFASLSGNGAAGVWVGQHNGVAAFDGVRWTSYPLGPQSGWQFITPVVLAPDDVWALAALAHYPDPRCTADHWDGTHWSAASVLANPGTSDCYQAATGWPQGGLLAGGQGGRLDVLTCAGRFQSMVGRTTSAELDAVWGSADNDIWAVGKNGTVLHDSGAAGWAPVAVPTTADLSAIWGAGATDVWAVGQGGTAIHWNGVRWTASSTGAATDLTAISGSGPDNVWAVSGGSSPSQVVRYDGTSWSLVRSAPGNSYVDIAVIAADDVWITGPSGFLHWTGAAFEPVPAPGPGDATPSGIKAYARDDIWADSPMRWVFHYDGATWSVVTAGGETHPGQTAGYGPFISKISGDPAGTPYFLMSGEIGPDGNIARLDSSGALAPLPKLYTGTQYNGLFILGHDVWLVGDGGAIERGYLPWE